jgi:uncharacterized membrane protein YeaQ/YmgE (transglycosylase-associated protein family)
MSMLMCLTFGVSVGLAARFVMGSKAYGVAVDVLLGIAGAVVVGFILGIPAYNARTTWADKAAILIWASAALPLVARSVAKRRASRIAR